MVINHADLVAAIHFPQKNRRTCIGLSTCESQWSIAAGQVKDVAIAGNCSLWRRFFIKLTVSQKTALKGKALFFSKAASTYLNGSAIESNLNARDA